MTVQVTQAADARAAAWAVLLAGMLGASAIALGAFAAHALRNTLDASLLAVLETSVRYQMFHALALLALAALPVAALTAGQRTLLALGFGLGTALFCGSLDLMVFTGWRALGAVTPLGGALLMATWTALAVIGWRRLR